MLEYGWEMMNMLRRLKLYKNGTATFEGLVRLQWAEYRTKIYLQDSRCALANAFDKAWAYTVSSHAGEGLALVAIFTMEGDYREDVHGVSKFDGQFTAAPLIYSLPVPWLKTLRDKMQVRRVPELRTYEIDVKPYREEKIPMRPDGADPTTLRAKA